MRFDNLIGWLCLAIHNIVIGLCLLSSGVAKGQSLRICYIPDSRSTYQDRGYTFDGRLMLHSGTAKILNKRLFGPNGIVPTSFELVPLAEVPIKGEAISGKGCSIVFLGRFFDPNNPNVLRSSEIGELKSWSLEHSNNVVIVSEHHSMYWGYEYVNDSSRSNFPTLLGKKTEIFNGPFGSISAFKQGGASYGSLVTSNGKSLAINTNGNSTISLDQSTNDVILGDIDLLTVLGGVSKGKHNKNNSDILFCNFWAFISQLAKKKDLSDSLIHARSATITNFQKKITFLVNFEQSKSSLLPSGITQLDSLIRLLGRQKVEIELHGYSDVIGDSRRNLSLSKRRVKSIQKYLIRNGVKRRYIKMRYYGSNHPLYRGNSEVQRAKNRRVEVFVTF